MKIPQCWILNLEPHWRRRYRFVRQNVYETMFFHQEYNTILVMCHCSLRSFNESFSPIVVNCLSKTNEIRRKRNEWKKPLGFNFCTLPQNRTKISGNVKDSAICIRMRYELFNNSMIWLMDLYLVLAKLDTPSNGIEPQLELLSSVAMC